MASIALLSYGLLPAEKEASPEVKSLAGRDSQARVRQQAFPTNGVVRRACSLAPELLLRIWRGYHHRRSEDLTMVPRWPNYPGGLELPSHSGPWDYLQQVPLVFYGPSRIKRSPRPIEKHVSITDVYPTVGELLDVQLEPRAGRVLTEALKEEVPGVPRLIVTVVWDGVGLNVLKRWPDSWPNLARLQRRGTFFTDATVGSSPSITPATHSSLGTGTFPRRHGITAIQYRNSAGRIQEAFAGSDPSDLNLTTFADQIDRDLENAPKVGLIAWGLWPLGMLGHGSEIPGGDADQFINLNNRSGAMTAAGFYSSGAQLDDLPSPTYYADKLDRTDGTLDGEWLDHDILRLHDNPAWVRYQSDSVLASLKRERYGQHLTPDLFFINFKTADIVGHHYTMDSQRMTHVLQAQDQALGRITRYLDRKVRDYVLILTADHGHVPSSARTGAWAIGNGEVRRDIDAHFGAPSGRSLVRESGSTGLFLNYRLMRALDLTDMDIARFLNAYTIKQSWRGSTLPEGYGERGDEQVFVATLPRSARGHIMECAFGGPRPPRGMDD
jgi:Type I phosphodiesterase / nucleotide pyrophosphatase